MSGSVNTLPTVYRMPSAAHRRRCSRAGGLASGEWRGWRQSRKRRKKVSRPRRPVWCYSAASPWLLPLRRTSRVLTRVLAAPARHRQL